MHSFKHIFNDDDLTQKLDGVQVYTDCQISDGRPCRECEHYIDFEEQVNALKTSFMQQLKQMQSHQRQLRAAINCRHDPLVRGFPPEIMANIFQLYVDSQHHDEKNLQQIFNNCSPLVLGAVSQSWRRIAWSCPQLWTRISINPRGSEHWTCLEVAQECFMRSGQLPLTITVSLYHPDINHRINNPQGIFRRLIHLINRYSSRWEELRVIGRAEILPFFCGDSQGAPIIRKIILEYPYDTYNRVPDELKFRLQGSKPQPTFVSLSNFGFKPLDIDWLRVTIAHCHKTTIPLDQFFELLQQAPQLTDCQLSSISDSERSFKYPMNEIPIVHHKLRSLQIGKYCGKELGLFFAFPQLTHFTIEHINDKESKVLLNSIVPLIQRSSCQLTFLRLHNVDCWPNTLIELLRTTQSLRELELSICKTSLCIFQVLADNTVARNSPISCQELFLPDLQSIRYFDIRPVWDAEFWTLISSIPGSPSDIHDPLRRPLNRVEFVCRQARWSDPKPESMVCKDRNVVLRFIELSKLGIQFKLLHANVDMLGNSMHHHHIETHEQLKHCDTGE